jgi:ferredoxin--NADP+ reductase
MFYKESVVVVYQSMKGTMYRILEKEDLAAQVYRYVIEVPDVARTAKAGQFVILRAHEEGERIPITIADWSSERGTITLYIQAVGKTTTLMSRLKAGDALPDVVGPLGRPSHVEPQKTLVAIGGGFGIAAIHPIVRAHKNIGNTTISIIGARSHNLLIMEKEMTDISDELLIATNDGSFGTRGMVTDVLQNLLTGGRKIDVCLAIGPVVMMKAVSELTRPHAIPTFVSLNPIMMDGTGMCGACRVHVKDEIKFACVDGPEFNGHDVDFDLLTARQKMYSPQEKLSMEIFEHQCKATPRVENSSW